MSSVQSIYRYPVKGLSPERLLAAELLPYKGIAGDRAHAIAHGETRFDPAQPEHLSKTRFLTLMTHPRLAELQLVPASDPGEIAVLHEGREFFRGNPGNPVEVSRLERFLQEFIGHEAKGMPRMVTATGHMFSDMREDCLSLVNLASVAELGKAVDHVLDPLRFRANVYLAGMPAWEERGWATGYRFHLGQCELEIIKHITRCNAINVDLVTAQRDLELTKVLFRQFEKNQMGFYAHVVSGGTLQPGDRLVAEKAN